MNKRQANPSPPSVSPSSPGFLDGLIVIMASAGLAIFLLWAASRTQGGTTFEQLPDWLRGTYGAVWGLVLSGTGLGLAVTKALTRKDHSSFNFLYATLGTTIVLLVLISILTYLFRSPVSRQSSAAKPPVQESKPPAPESKPPAPESKPPAPESKPPAPENRSASYTTKCIIPLNKAGNETNPDLHEFKDVIGTNAEQLWRASCFGFQPKVRVTGTITGTFGEAGSNKDISVKAGIAGGPWSIDFGGKLGASGFASYSQPFAGFADDQGEVMVQMYIGRPAHLDGASITAGPGSQIEITAHPAHASVAMTNNQKSGDDGQCANLAASGDGTINCSATQAGKDNAQKNPQKH